MFTPSATWLPQNANSRVTGLVSKSARFASLPLFLPHIPDALARPESTMPRFRCGALPRPELWIKPVAACVSARARVRMSEPTPRPLCVSFPPPSPYIHKTPSLVDLRVFRHPAQPEHDACRRRSRNGRNCFVLVKPPLGCLATNVTFSISSLQGLAIHCDASRPAHRSEGAPREDGAAPLRSFTDHLRVCLAGSSAWAAPSVQCLPSPFVFARAC